MEMGRLARSRAARFGLAGWIGIGAALAVAPATFALNPVTLTTPYPAIDVAPGANVELTVEVETQDPGRVDLSLDGVPADWTASLRGGGFLVNSVQSNGSDPTEVTLDVTVPETATEGEQRITLKALSDGSTASLPIDITVTPNAAGEVTLETDFPELRGSTDSSFSFTLTLRNDTPDDLTFGATASGPPGWTVDAKVTSQAQAASAIVEAGSSTSIEVTAEAPQDAPADVYPITVQALSDGSTASLPIDITVTPNAAGEVSLTTDFPELKGSTDASFSFTLTLRNDTPDDLTFGVAASGPPGWTVDAKVTSQAQAASAIVEAGSSTSIEVTAEAPQNAAADVYPITVEASSGDTSAQAELSVEITGSYDLTLTTPDGRLSANASAGSQTDLSLVLRNDGTAEVADVRLSASTPTGWTVTFEPETVTVPAQSKIQVTARLTPSGNAIAGDYVATFNARSDLADAEAQMRVTIETSLLWGVVGIGLIGLVLAGLWWTFRRYGRR